MKISTKAKIFKNFRYFFDQILKPKKEKFRFFVLCSCPKNSKKKEKQNCKMLRQNKSDFPPNNPTKSFENMKKNIKFFSFLD